MVRVVKGGYEGGYSDGDEGTRVRRNNVLEPQTNGE